MYIQFCLTIAFHAQVVMASKHWRYTWPAATEPDSDDQEVELDGHNTLLRKQLELAEVTGVPTVKESELLLNLASCTRDRKWAVENWESPESYHILQDWVTDEIKAEEQSGMAMTFKLFEPGDVLHQLTQNWCLAKLMYCCWCVNWGCERQNRKDPCFCIQATALMPAGCQHRRPRCDKRFCQEFCRECAKCIRCMKYLGLMFCVINSTTLQHRCV